MRQALVLVHRWAGLAMAAFLVMTGLTGSIIAFDSELDAWLNPELFRTESRGVPLPPDVLSARVETAWPGLRVTSVPVNLRPDETARIGIRPGAGPATGLRRALGFDQVFADPVTGAILGTRDTGACCSRRTIIPFLYRFHYMLQLPGQWGQVGRWLLGAVAVVWLLDCFVGAWLTLPRGGAFWRKWQIAWLLKRRAAFHRINLDLHRATGLWLWGLLLLLAVSSIYFNLYRELFRPAVELLSPLTPTVYDRRVPLPLADQHPAIGFSQALALAVGEADRRGWALPPDRIYYNARDYYAITFRPSQDRRGNWLGRPVIEVDAQDGRLLDVIVPGSGSLGDVIMDAQLPIHSGEILGLPGRILVSAAGLAVAMLSLTGVVIWWRKRSARRLMRPRRS